MEWVETTGATVAAALSTRRWTSSACDEDEVEYQVLQEPKSGLFGRIGGNPQGGSRPGVKADLAQKPGDRQRGGRGRSQRRGRRGNKRNSGAEGVGERGAARSGE